MRPPAKRPHPPPAGKPTLLKYPPCLMTRILLTNDDGYDAPGLYAAWQAVEAVWPGCGVVIAPDRCHSAKSHATTTHPESPLVVEPLDHPAMRGCVIGGYPADCARVGLRGLDLPEAERTILVSGVNPGGNLGIDVYYSGTVAAAREAAALGVSAVALSAYIRRENPIDWETIADWAAVVLRTLKERLESEPTTLWNVNMAALPKGEAMPPISYVPVSTDPLAVSFRREEEDGRSAYVYTGPYQNRPKRAGTDVETVLSGGIAVSPLRLDATDETLLDTLRGVECGA